ncbi:MAG: hypothetical protein GY849_03670 [Deltaproteobacteria bacterium]|nr:hypothetical protein [Deltaproteobacteria bacterium]
MADTPPTMDTLPSVGQKLAELPIGDLVTSMGESIAYAQLRLDETSLKIAHMMSGLDPEDRIIFGGKAYSLFELGFTPAFYQFTETTLEVKMTITMSLEQLSVEKKHVEKPITKTETERVAKRGSWGKKSYETKTRTVKVGVTTFDTELSNKFQFSATGTSSMKTKLVPVPPPAILEERIRMVLDQEKAAGKDLYNPNP